ncbi:unnamed protein product [marine sediment metagenome]|uniref:Uncharacterized protein n=1 Tax=marine sediment metagenome TaxID=412755 RepID=X1SSS8_9ZZZZ
MWNWIKKNQRGIITALVTVALCIWLYACESKVRSLDGSGQLINRAELQLELDRFMATAQIRMADLDRQDAFRSLIIENSIVIAQGQPFSLVGLITGIAGIYGLTHATSKVVSAAKKSQAKRKANNGTG